MRLYLRPDWATPFTATQPEDDAAFTPRDVVTTVRVVALSAPRRLAVPDGRGSGWSVWSLR
ncbi:hypothetical protein [Streptosporangium longisporum]|uniref:hypothetical protein n=1 Tax=Streptosporangium longisporum TaxID=46187 RepID=UPI0031EE1565